MTTLFLRVFVESSQEQARSAAASIIAALRGSALPHRVGPVRPYWKTPTYHELVVQIDMGAGAQVMLADLLERLGAGWELINELEAVWNPGPGATFLCEQARWAHVELTDGIR